MTMHRYEWFVIVIFVSFVHRFHGRYLMLVSTGRHCVKRAKIIAYP